MRALGADDFVGFPVPLQGDGAADGPPGADADLAALAATFAGLARRGTAERRLALAVLRDIGDYAERRPSRSR